jgi:hypothetical protein
MTSLKRDIGRAVFNVVLAIAACYVVWSFVGPIRPFPARRKAALNTLKRLASQVNEYHQQSGVLPHSLAELGAELDTAANYELLLTGEKYSFVVVADRVYRDVPGQGYRLGCDQDLRIVRLPPTQDER